MFSRENELSFFVRKFLINWLSMKKIFKECVFEWFYYVMVELPDKLIHSMIFIYSSKKAEVRFSQLLFQEPDIEQLLCMICSSNIKLFNSLHWKIFFMECINLKYRPDIPFSITDIQVHRYTGVKFCILRRVWMTV